MTNRAGRSRLMSVTGSIRTIPTGGKVIADILAGVYGAYGVIAALHDEPARPRPIVRTSLLAAVVASQGTAWLVRGHAGATIPPLPRTGCSVAGGRRPIACGTTPSGRGSVRIRVGRRHGLATNRNGERRTEASDPRRCIPLAVLSIARLGPQVPAERVRTTTRRRTRPAPEDSSSTSSTPHSGRSAAGPPLRSGPAAVGVETTPQHHHPPPLLSSLRLGFSDPSRTKPGWRP